MEDMIRIQVLAKHYDGFTLENIGFSVPAGSVVGLIGSNGAGKTTTLKIILGLTTADGGDVRLLGCDPRGGKDIDKIKARVGIVLDTCAFPDVSKVADVGTLGRAAYATWDDRRFKSLCDEFGLEPRKTVKDLSRGMGMKLTLAFALSHDPELLVLDEATAAMDTETERLIQDALSALIEGRTTITIAHRLSTLKDCNHLFVIENGEIAEEGTHAELLAKKGTFYRLYMLQNEANKKIIAGM